PRPRPRELPAHALGRLPVAGRRVPARMVTVVGIGADGWSGLSEDARAALLTAKVVVGSARQLALLDESVGAERVPLPSPLLPAVGELATRDGVCCLASGDPMLHGIGATLAKRMEVRVITHVSSVALACAQLGWAEHEVEVVRPVGNLAAAAGPGKRLLVLI